MWRISQQSGVSTNRVVRINSLENPDKLVIGLALLIPEPYLQYRVLPGNTIQKIANQFGTTIQEIMQTNHLTNPSTIYTGQRLTIPVFIIQ
ncbi:LysM peptidoglycan-binding domain-containing protein [Peribacillus frigoritolerans]|uniref:LysM peptidoglycan-binding domain-containing protein n=1 Tax=Peribacillus TaxID=2675229 RepID=UPI0039A11D7D